MNKINYFYLKSFSRSETPVKNKGKEPEPVHHPHEEKKPGDRTPQKNPEKIEKKKSELK